jgi:hypothetical protein
MRAVDRNSEVDIDGSNFRLYRNRRLLGLHAYSYIKIPVNACNIQGAEMQLLSNYRSTYALRDMNRLS